MYKYILLGLSTIAVIAAGILFEKYSTFLASSSDKISYYGFSLTILSIVWAVIESSKNHDWNRRKSAMDVLLTMKTKIKEHSDLVHETFGFRGKGETQIISVEDIHDAICKKDAKGKFVRNETTKLLELNDSNSEIYTSIWEMLNLYEHMAAGVYQGVYDRDVIETVMASNFIKVSSIFSEYINHVNNEMYPNRKGRTWENLVSFGDELKRKHRGEQKVKPRSKT